MGHTGNEGMTVETRMGRVETSVVVCNAPYNACDFLLAALRSLKGTHGAPGDGWKPFPLHSDMTLVFARKNPAPKMKTYGTGDT